MFEKSVIAAMAGAAIAAAACVQAAASVEPQATAPDTARPVRQPTPHAKPKLDVSGRTRVGKASFYAGKFRGRTMADGTPMDPRDDSAASKTLPLGTTAKVTNLETGESAVVTIRDRGPYVRGRIVDLTPATAAQVGIDRHEGVSKVQVTPIALPPSNDSANLGGVSPGKHPASAGQGIRPAARAASR
jgi:rare lipoprotein A